MHFVSPFGNEMFSTTIFKDFLTLKILQFYYFFELLGYLGVFFNEIVVNFDTC
jgi:hypothetical protein